MIKLIKSTFFNEKETREKLADFVLNAKQLSMGEQCRKFEENFAKRQGRQHAIFVNSGSSANLLLVQALMNLGRLKLGDTVGVSALTWSTNIMPLIQLGLRPVLIDCERENLNVSPKTLVARLKETPLTALFITNTLGLSDDLTAIAAFCAKNNILFIEDNCEALGSVHKGKLLGNHGLAATFSFFVGHHLSTIEGGMIVTDDEELADALNIARSHGWDRHLKEAKRRQLRAEHSVDDFYAKYTFYDLGFNVRPTEINGFLGNLQLVHWDTIVQKRFENFKRLNAAIAKNPGLLPVTAGQMDLVSSFAIPVIVRDRARVAALRHKFEENEVEVRPMIAGNIARQPFHAKHVGATHTCPNADFIHDHSFYFGNNPELTEEELKLLEKLVSGPV